MDKFSWHEGKGAKWYLLFKKKGGGSKKLKTLKTTFYKAALKALCEGPFYLYTRKNKMSISWKFNIILKFHWENL